MSHISRTIVIYHTHFLFIAQALLALKKTIPSLNYLQQASVLAQCFVIFIKLKYTGQCILVTLMRSVQIGGK